MSRIEITTATVDEIDELGPLFDGYRVFYRQPSDPARTRTFLLERLRNDESVLFLARCGGEPAGFIQMFPSFSSVATAPIWILNDLYVEANMRRLGVAKALMDHAFHWARERKSVRLVLETASDNHSAKTLYEALGWRKVTQFDRYAIELVGN